MNRKRILAWLLTLAMIVSLFPMSAFADTDVPAEPQEAVVEEVAAAAESEAADPEAASDEVKTVTINLLGQVEKNTLAKVLFGFEVSSSDGPKYGYTKPEAYMGEVTMLDAAAALHREIYGEAFENDPTAYLKISSAGTCTLIFGEATYMNGFHVNDVCPEYPDQPGTGSLWNDTPLNDGDSVRIFKVNGDDYGMMESYLMFDKGAYTAHEGGSAEVEVTGDLTFGTMMGMPANVTEIEGAAVYAVTDFTDPAGSKVAEAVSDEDGIAEFENLPAGEYHLVVGSYENDYEEDCFSTPYATLSVSAHEWTKTVTPASFEADGSRVSTCSVCEATETEVLKKYGFTVTADGEAVSADDITITPNGYDASYEDWQTHEKVESMIPLATVKIPADANEVKVTLNDAYDTYCAYYYTAAPDETGYTQFVANTEWGTYDEARQMYVAAAGTPYTAAIADNQVIRVQTEYDANWVSDNLYAIAFEKEASAELADGTYNANGLSTAVLSMYHFHDAQVVVKGDEAWLITTEDTDNTVKRFDGMAYGPQSQILDPADETNHTLVEGTVTARVVPVYQEDGTTLLTRTFVLPVPKSVLAAGDDIYYMIKYVDGYSAAHDGDWYKASGGDYYLTGYTLEYVSDSTVLPGDEPQPAEIELTIENKTGMFKAVTATAVANEDGSATLTFALSGSGYHYLYKGTYEQAVANGDATENWIAGALNADDKWEFQIPVAAEELGKEIPVVAISDSYYQKYLNGQNSLARAFYPRQFSLDLAAATLVTGDYESSKTITVTNNVSMFSPGETATLDTVGGPNSNNYKADLVLPMTTASMSEVFVGTPKEAEAEGAATIAFDAETSTFTIPVKWVETFGQPETLVTLCDGEPFVLSFKSARNGNWYGREAILDETAGTLVFNNWIDPTPATTVDELIAKIQVQYFTDTTWADCEAAKAAWDALSDAEKALVEEYDYFGRDTGNAALDDPLNQDDIGENEILVVSFGTSFNDSRVATVGGVEKAIAAAYPEWSVRRAFTAQIIINHIYARDGEKIDNMQQALERAVENGVKKLVVQPTHLMHGAEYDELVEALAPYQDKMEIIVSEPLLGEVGADGTVVNADKEVVAKAVVAAADVPADTALVLMGHGTGHTANITYTQMQTMMDQLGYSNVFVGTVEGEPEGTDCGSIIAAVKAAGFSKVVLRPLMVVAGDHANNDMADPDDEESWFSQFTADGSFSSIECQIAGLGEIEAVQQLYVAHIADALNQEPQKDISGAEAALSAESFDYTGAAIEPEVTVTYEGTVLVKDTDYTVEYRDNINAGTATAAITGIGAYTGTLEKTFEIHKYGADGYCEVCKEFIFTDVTKGIKYVSWAYEKGIVTGTGAHTFTPDSSCTKLQFVMMLWKMNGSKTIKGAECPFTDVTGSKAQKAVTWAVTEGIINKGTKFNPGSFLTRAQIVMMLWKMAGSPEVSGTNPFSDVEGAKLTKAVLWAYNNGKGITKGTSATTFSPENNCTRVQLVTFLYKYNDIYKLIK